MQKTISKATAVAIAAFIALQAFAPSLTVLADEIPDTEEPSEVLEIVETEPETEKSEPEAPEAEEPVIEEDDTEVPKIEINEESTEEQTFLEVENADEYINAVSSLPGSDVLVIATSDELNIEADAGIYYDGSYTLSFSDNQAYCDAASYADASGYEYTTDDLFIVCGNEASIANEPVNPNGSVKVAVIDTGSNNANEIVSVLGDDGSDANSHDTNKYSDSRELTNANRFVKDSDYAYDYYVGGKTGFTDTAGFTLCAAACKDGRTLVGVVFNAEDSEVRYRDLVNLFEYGFSHFTTVPVSEEEFASLIDEARLQLDDLLADTNLYVENQTCAMSAYVTTTTDRAQLGSTDKVDLSQVLVDSNASEQTIVSAQRFQPLPRPSILTIFSSCKLANTSADT